MLVLRSSRVAREVPVSVKSSRLRTAEESRKSHSFDEQKRRKENKKRKKKVA